MTEHSVCFLNPFRLSVSYHWFAFLSQAARYSCCAWRKMYKYIHTYMCVFPYVLLILLITDCMPQGGFNTAFYSPQHHRQDRWRN